MAHADKPSVLGALGMGPVEPAGPNRVPQECGDIGLKIARDGTWFYQGSPIGRKTLVKLFASVLRREEDGRFYLVTPVEKVFDRGRGCTLRRRRHAGTRGGQGAVAHLSHQYR